MTKQPANGGVGDNGNGNGDVPHGAPESPFAGLSLPIDEEKFLSCLLVDPGGSRELLKKTTLSPLLFDDLRNRHWFEVLREIHLKDEPIDVDHILSRFAGETDSKGRYVALLAADPFPNRAHDYIKPLQGMLERRRAVYAAQTLQEMARNTDSDATGLLSDFVSTMQSLAPKGKQDLPEIEDAVSLMDVDLPEPKQLISGLLHQGTKLALGGGSKSFKTWILTDLAIAVATGSPWLGFDTSQAKVLYLNMEIKRVFFKKRIVRICKQRDVGLLAGQLDVWNLQGRTASFEELIPRIIERIQSREYGLVVLDPVYKLYGNLDENKAGDIGRLMTSMDRLCFESGACIAFGAHFSKGNQSGKEAIDRMSGSGVFARDPDSILTLTAHEEQNCFVIESTLRNLAPVNPFVVRWDFPCMNRDSDLNPDKLKKMPGRPSVWDAKTILECLPESGLISSDWQAACEDQKGVSKATFYRLKSELQQNGKILLSRIHNRWVPIRSKST